MQILKKIAEQSTPDLTSTSSPVFQEMQGL